MSKEQHKKLSTFAVIIENMEDSLMKCAPHILIRESHDISILAMSNSLQAKKEWKVVLQSIQSHTEYLLQTVTYTVVKKSVGKQRKEKVAPKCKHCSYCGWWKAHLKIKYHQSEKNQACSLRVMLV